MTQKNFPRNGWLEKEDGGVINQGDAIEQLDEANPTSQSRKGKYYRTTWSGEVPGNTTYDFILDIPSGLKIYGISRDQSAGPGRLDIEFRVGGTWSTEEFSSVGYNMDETLGDTSQASFKRVSDLSGSGLRASGLMLSATSNAGKSASTQTINGLHPRFDENTIPVFRYTNPGSNPVVLKLNLIWEEE